MRRRIIASAPIPGNWHNFPRVDLDKQELFSFLSKALIQSFDEDNKELVVIDGEQVLCVPPQQDIYSLAPCSHEEADTCMLLHAAHTAQHGHNWMHTCICTGDTDVVVLAVMVAQALPAKD